jgi:tetratricopeptide (TPR) repeat protein
LTEQAIVSISRYLAAKPGGQEKRVVIARRQLFSIRNPGRIPDEERAAVCLERALGRIGAADLVGALELFDAAIAADPLSSEAWINRGVCLLALSRFEDALACYVEAEALIGPARNVVQPMAACLLRLGRSEDALRCFDRLLARTETSREGLEGKARALVEVGRAGEALPLYEHLVARWPDDAALRAERANVLLMTKRMGSKEWGQVLML